MDSRKPRLSSITLVLLTILSTSLVPAVRAQAKDCSNTSTGLIPLTDLGAGTYEGEMGGLYPDGSNEIPPAHLELGLELSTRVVPRGADGTPDENGLIGFASIGVSNTVGKFQAFMEKVSTVDSNPELVLINGAQQGRSLGVWANRRNDVAWDTLEEKVADQGLSPQQVQVAWVMLPDGNRGPPGLTEARDGLSQLTRVLQTAKDRFPNLVLAYFSSRIYGGYIEDIDSEPNAYHHGFQVKWLIEEQIEGSSDLSPGPDEGAARVPWIAWGPYLWADGTAPRSDGLVWECADFDEVGVHPGPTGTAKVADLLMEHFTTDPTAAGWFLEGADTSATSSTTVPPTTVPPTTVASTIVTTSLPTPETSLGAVPSTRPGGRAGRDVTSATGAASPWPSLVTGVGAGLLIGAIVGLLIRTLKSKRYAPEPD